MTVAARMEELPEKNTFIHFDEPKTPAKPPTNSAPGALEHGLQMKDEMLEHDSAETPPVEIQQKNTFVHFEDPKTPAAPPVHSAPDKTVFLAPPCTTMTESVQSTDSVRPDLSSSVATFRTGLSSVQSSVGTMPSDTPGQVVVGNNPLNRMNVQQNANSALTGAVQLSDVVTAKRAGMASVGSDGHCSGRCVPCLMQVRWLAGKCDEPCKFGALCARCHEDHTEEELHQVQVQMRKEKKKHGGKLAA
mmetsp:Transcript_69324/g.174725  ORF Transcript_69324/g.174725 Transcript_69324/m.174725 type:complete len:247 (+) Transcript_69324:74-814(+)|eukprot:CAMPEP_0115252862 /NCGR_PEP_ID=MMETSP0270-20121206/44368_1 /TAXON_ID=71861 /ORGANISM="Scrippsiella trochoidea, Strain CCMP3099" /LENGTH=246 /DNA_ID=CAMNT_0002668335 /DNA_START=71 /DNA_END=814 /DNA_ORIENTATION=+